MLSTRCQPIRILACCDPSLQEKWLATRKTELRVVLGGCENHRCRGSGSTVLHCSATPKAARVSYGPFTKWSWTFPILESSYFTGAWAGEQKSVLGAKARENAHQFGFEEPTLMLLSALESVERVGDGCHFSHQHLCRLHEGTESSFSSAWSLGPSFPFFFFMLLLCQALLEWIAWNCELLELDYDKLVLKSRELGSWLLWVAWYSIVPRTLPLF